MKTILTAAVAAVLGACVLVRPAAAQSGMGSPLPWGLFAPQAAEPASFLGVYLAEVGPETVAQLDLPAERGAHVREVMEESPAAAAGIRADDVIVEWDAVRVGSAVQLKRLVSETPPGRAVTASLIRGGDTRTVEVTVGRRMETDDGGFGFSPAPIPFDQWHPDVPGLPQDPFPARQGPPRLGIEMQALSEQLAAFFGLEDGRLGVLVAGVLEDSAAAEAGLRAGDVIVRVDGRDVASIPEVQRAISAARDAAELEVIRDGNAMTLTAALRPADGAGADDDVRELVIPAEEDPATPAGEASPGAPRYPKEAM